MGVKERYEKRQKEEKTASYFGVEQRYMAKEIENIGSSIINRVNTWLQNHNNYISNYQKRNASRKYTYEDSYVSDSASWLDTVSKQKSNFDAEADGILSYMDQYKGYLNEDWVKEISDTLTEAREKQQLIVDNSTKDNQWWSNFESEEMVKQYGSAEDAYKYFQRADGYSKKHSDLATYNDVKKVLATLEDGEEKDWLTSYGTQLDRKEKGELDIGTAEAELEAMKEYANQVFTIDIWYGSYEANPNAYSEEEIQRNMAAYNDLKERYGSIEGLEQAIADKELYINQAKRVQEANKLKGVADSTSENYDPNFLQNIGYAGSEKLPLIPDYKDIAYGYINGDQNTKNGKSVATAWGRLSDKEKQRLVAIDKMNEDERNLYNYYYNTQGYDAAENYLSLIIEDLNTRVAYDYFEPMKGKWGLEYLFGSIAGLDQFNSGISNLFSGEDYIPSSAIQQTSALVRDDLKDDGFKLPKWMGGASIGQAGYDVITTTTNMVPSILTSAVVGMANPAAGAVVGSGLMGASAAGNAYQEVLNMGYDKGQARAYSTLVGASEAGLQYLLGGIGKVGGAFTGKAAASLASKFDKAFMRLAVKYGTNMLGEGVEEYLQEILTPVFKNLTLKTDEEVGLVTEEAIYSFLLGSLTSFFMESTGISSENGKSLIGEIRDMSSKNKKNIEAATKYGDFTAELIEEGLASPTDSESYKLAEMFKRKTDKGKSMTGYEIRQLVAANEAQFVVENYEEALPLAKQRLAELGETGDVDEIAKLVAKKASGQKLTLAEKSTLVRSQYGAKVAKEMTPATTDLNYKPLEGRVGTEDKLSVSESGQATVRATGEAIDLSKVEVADFVTDKKSGKVTDMILKADGKEVKASEIDFADDSQSYLFSAVKNIENITPGDATVFVRDYNPSSGQTVGEYLNGIDEAYTYGYHNYSEADLKAGNFTTDLTSEQMMSAYKLGQSARAVSKTNKVQAIKRMRTAVQAATEKAIAEGKAAPKTKGMSITYNYGGGKVVSIEEAEIKSGKQEGGVAVANLLLDMNLGTSVEFFSSKVVKDGNGNKIRVFVDDNGVEQKAYSGVYRKSDGTIRIDLNAYNGKGLTLNALSHELTHFIQQWSPEKYEILADFLMKTYEKTDMTMHERVLREQARLKGIRGEEVSYNEAYDEVVANAMSKMFDDGKLLEKLQKLAVKDKSLVKKILEGIKAFFNKFVAVYEKQSALFHDSADIMEIKENLEKLQNIFAEALVDASENYRASLTASKGQTLTKVGNELGSQQSSQETDFSQDFDYSDLNWATDIGIITGKDKAIFERTINNEIYRGAKPQSANGEYIIDTGKCLMFTDGDFHNPTLSRVIVFATEYESLTADAKRRIIDEAEATGKVQVSLAAIESLFGEGFVSSYIRPTGQTYAWQNRGRKGSNGNRTTQTVRAKSLKERFAEEGLSHLLEEDAVYSSQETDLDSVRHKINTSMTMAEAKRMIETAYRVNNIAEYYEDEYTDAEDWLRKAGADEVEMYIENDFDLQARYINSNEDILNEEYRMADVLEAYLAGTLIGREKPMPKRLDVSQSTKLQDSRFYSPQKIEDAKETYKLAIQKAVGKDANAIKHARANILLFAHNKGAAELLGITQAELNKKLRSWSNYSATARDISKKINTGVAEENRWTGIENSSYINKTKVTNEDIERLVASVEGDSKGYERKYIARVMLAADTHIDYSGLKFKFASSQQVNADNKGGNNGGNRVLGFYDDTNRLIEVAHDKPHTVAHEIGHYIDAQWGRDLIGTNSSHLFLTRGVNEDMVRARYGEPGVQFLKNFKLFINSLSDVNQNYNSYYNDRGEIFARFFARFIEWTDNIATGNKYYSYESAMYNDKFTQAQFVEFARLLQEKALLDGKVVSKSGEQYSSQETDADKKKTEQEVDGNERREETKEAFLGRAGKTLPEVKERGALTFGYRRYSGKLSQIVQEAEEGLKKLSIPVVVFEQMEGNKNGITTVYNNDAMAIPGEAIFIHKDATEDALVIVGHESYHYLAVSDSRTEYEEVLTANVDFASEAFNSYQKEYVEDIYFSDGVEIGSKEWVVLMEEIFAYITGDIHNGDPKGKVHKFLRDYDAVKAAWDDLLKKQSADTLHSTQETDNISNRELLANAFEGITKDSDEYKLIQEYKSRIKLLNEQEEKLNKLNAEIRKIRFGMTGARDTARLAQLEAEAKNTAKAINRHDKKLLSLEASEPLRKVIERERKKEAQKTKKHIKEIQQNKKTRAEQTELRHKIRKTIRDLDKVLNRGNKKRNVKEDMQNVVSTALKAADILFTDNYGTYDMLRNGIGADMSDSEESLVATCTKMLEDLDKMPTDGYENWQGRQEAESKLRAKMSKLNEVFARERKRLNNTTVSSILGELADAYAKLDESEQSYVQGAYSEPVHNFLKNLQSEVGGTIVKDMTKGQLESVYAAYKMVLTTVRKANQMFNEELKQSREQLGNAVIGEVLKAGGVHLLGTKMGDAISRFDWNNMKPIWLANRIGSETFGKLIQGLFKGQYNFAVDIDEAKRFKLSMDEKYHSREWDAEKLYAFQSSTGKKFSLNLQQLMSLYAFCKREQAYSHLLNGGFVFEDNSTVVVDGKLGIKRTYIHKGATSYKLNVATLNDIINSLTAEQKAYVDEMQKYLSDVMGAKGNEVSMQLYGIKMFNEQFYFPLHSSGAYMERAKEAEMKKQQGQINLVNSGFTHAVKPQAKNPIILSGFMDVWAEHCNEMSMYHSMVLPMEDFRKVYNYSTIHDEKMESASVFQTIQDAYGKAATSYIDQLYRELNAGATIDPRETPWKKLISNFKKSAVMLSGSVVVQQFSSIGRAYAVIEPKYFVGTKVNSDTKLSVVEEMKKYAPVAIIKEMGGFDTGTKGNAKSYIMAEQYGKGERIKGFVADAQYRGDFMGFLPAWADEKTWCAIWEATKRETKAKHPKMDVKSEEFLKLAGERFSEVIEKTQVYDSVLARSANMRSKGNFMAMATAFMAEPTTTVNLIEDAIRTGKAKNIARAFGSVAVSIILNNALASIVYAMRDDDEDETFIEKYFQSFTSGIIDDINPMSYYPFLKDVYALFQGYDVERTDMSVIADVRDALKRAVSLLGKDTSEMDDDELAKHYKEVNEVFMGLLDAGCSMFGVPVKNVRRDVKGIINAWNTIGTDLSGERDNSWLSFWDKVGAAAKDTIPVYALVVKDRAKIDKLYDAIISGDKVYLARLKSTYKTDSAYQSAVRKALRENDPRIQEAAQARYDGNTEEYKRIFREIQNENKFNFDDIMSAINTELSKLEPDSATSTYAASDFVSAVVMGDTRNAEAIKEDIIATKVANGKTQGEAEKEFASSVSTGIRDAYISGLLDEAGAEQMLMEYADKDEEEATSKVSYWTFCEEHPEYDFSESNVKDYIEFAESAGITLDVFEQYIEGTKDLTTKKDEWGDVEVTKREQVLEVIDSLPLTWEQKDALYLAAGYSEDKIWDVPW